MRLRTLLLIVLLGLGIAPAAVLVTLNLPTVVATFEEAAANEALLKARAQAAELYRRLERRKETARNIAMLPAPLEILNAASTEGVGLYLNIRQALERFALVGRRWFGEASDFRRMVLLDRGGVELLRLEPGEQGVVAVPGATPLSGEFPDMFAAIVAGGPREPRAMLVAATLRLRVAAPVRSLEGAVIGVLALEFDLQDVFGALAESVWVDGGGRYVHQGAVAVRPGNAFDHYPQLRRAEGDVVLASGMAWVALRLDEAPNNLLWIGTPLDHEALDTWLWRLRLRIALIALALVLGLTVAVRFIAARVETAKGVLMDGLGGIVRGEDGATFPWIWPVEARQLAEELTTLGARHAEATRARRTAEEQLFHEKERAEITLLSIADGVLSTDAEGRVRYANPAACRLLQRHHAEIEGQRVDGVLTLVDEARRMMLGNPAVACLHGEPHADVGTDAVLLRPGGAEVAVEVTAAPMHDRDGRIDGAVVALRDVAQERKLRRLLAHQAAHDPLTGLMNRRAFEERLKLALSEAHNGDSVAQWLCYVDLDQFKLINDTCGHLAGDELLKQVATELKAGVRDGDVVARTGGDEFGVLLRRCTREVAYELAERLRRRLAELRFAWLAQSFTTSGSFGLVPVHQRSGSLYDLLSAADRACYVAKDRGRNRIHVADTQDEATQQFGGEMRWAHATIQALEEDRLVLYAQPIRALGAGADGFHAEILVRMRGEDGAIIPPGAFIPAAERYNLMRDVDRWVVRHAMHAFAGRSGPGDMVAVNLSAQSLCDDDFLGFLLVELDESGIDPSTLCFEVTETAAMSNLTRAQEVIRVLKGRGCRFALDDFGSGLSSFGYLKNLQVDFLKIDGGFVRHVVDSTLDRAFVQSINDIGHLMGIATIAEYVESPEIEAILREMRVDYAQGYAVGRPEPLEAMLAGLDAGRRVLEDALA